MVEFLAYNEEGLFREIAARAREQGVANSEAWNDLVEQVIEEHREVGELDDDEPLEDLEDNLQKRYRDFEATLNIKE